MTPEMIERTKTLDVEWKDEGGGYFSLIGQGFMGALAYVALPEGHPDIGKEYEDASPDVNGGLTYARGNVFGWDFMHAFNNGDPATDIASALGYFRSRAAASPPEKDQ